MRVLRWEGPWLIFVVVIAFAFTGVAGLAWSIVNARTVPTAQPTPWVWAAPSRGPACVVFGEQLGPCYDPLATP